MLNYQDELVLEKLLVTFEINHSGRQLQVMKPREPLDSPILPTGVRSDIWSIPTPVKTLNPDKNTQICIFLEVESCPAPHPHSLTRAWMPPRRHWQLCNGHRSCTTCKNAIESWKQKAQRSSWNASRLKYALMCLIEENNEIVYQLENGEEEIYPITEGMDVEPGKDDILNWSCGICHENHAKVGARRPVVFNCTHSVCASCYSEPSFLEQRKCPYCRDVILKKALLLVFNT